MVDCGSPGGVTSETASGSGARLGTAAGGGGDGERAPPRTAQENARPAWRAPSRGADSHRVRSRQRNRAQREPGVGLGQDDDPVAIDAIELFDALEIGERLERHAGGAPETCA